MTEKPSYAILRIGKIKSFATLDAVEWHNTRAIPAGTVEGAPPPEDLVQMTGTYRERVKRIFGETGSKHAEGKVLATEVLVTTSPEWWVQASDADKEEWWRVQLRFAKDLFGPGLIAFTPHLDESTPHAQFVGLPLYQAVKKKSGPKPKSPEALRKREEEEASAAKIWRLSHDKVFGGSSKRLAELQTRYYSYVKHLGLVRGRDTVGQDVKHQTLKHYQKLLTQMERDLARAAEELREDRQVRDHYEDELRKGYEQLRADELALFGQQEEHRVRAEALERRQKDLEAEARAMVTRHAELDTREAIIVDKGSAITAREKMLEVDQSKLDADRLRAAADHEKINVQDAQSRERRADVSLREQAVAIKEATMAEEVQRQRIVSHQLQIVGGLFTGRLTGAWDATRGRPEVTRGVLNEQEQDALAQPWGSWLGLAVRHASQMATARARIAKRVQRIITMMRKKREDARSDISARKVQIAQIELRADAILAATRKAERETTRNVDAAKSQAAKHHEAMSQAISIKSAAEKQTQALERRRNQLNSEVDMMQQRLSSSTADIALQETGARKQLATLHHQQSTADASLQATETRVIEAKKELQEAVDAKASTLLIKSEASDAIDILKSEAEELERRKTALQRDRQTIATDVAMIKQEHKDLEKNVSRLRSEKTQLETDRIQFEQERQEFSLAKTRMDRSRTLMSELFAGNVAIEVKAESLSVSVPSAAKSAQAVIPKTQVEPWVETMVSTHGRISSLLDSLDQSKAELKKSRAALAKRFPEQAVDLAQEQAAETKMLDRRLMRQPFGQEGMGM